MCRAPLFDIFIETIKTSQLWQQPLQGTSQLIRYDVLATKYTSCQFTGSTTMQSDKKNSFTIHALMKAIIFYEVFVTVR